MSIAPNRPTPTSPASPTRPATAPAAPASGTPAASGATQPAAAAPVLPADHFAVRTGPAATDALVGTTATKPERTATTRRGRAVSLTSPEVAQAGVHLSSAGHFVLDPTQAEPRTIKEKGDALYRAADLLDSGRANLLGDRSISMTRKKALFANLSAALDEAAVNAPDTGFENPTQKLQQRASAGALLLNLAENLKADDPKQKSLKDAAWNRYQSLVEQETNPILRDSLIYNAQLSKTSLTPAARAKVDELMRDVAPLTPPYDQWFANGNNKLNVDVHVMDEFWGEELAAYKKAGYKPVSEAPGNAVLQKTVKDDKGQETVITLNCKNSTSGIFNKMSDPNTHVTVYSGHANWGRLVRQNLQNAPAQDGGKLSMILQCCGRGIMDDMAAKYPDTQLITTKFSSYGNEDQNTMLKTLEGIGKRQPWQTISKSINGDSWNNSRRNYTFPSDPFFRKRQLDRDKDGMADAWDKVVNFNTFNVPQDVANSFTPKAPPVEPGRLEGGKIHGAVGMFNTSAGFSEFLEDTTQNQVANAGWFAPKAGETDLCRVTKQKDAEGKDVFRVQMNASYAHASQESLNARAHYELQQYFLKQSGTRLSEQDRKLSGLLLAAHAMKIDEGYHSTHDGEVFNKLREQSGLPASVTIDAVRRALDTDHDYYSGSMKSLQALKSATGLK